jgi:hypothetical protein
MAEARAQRLLQVVIRLLLAPLEYWIASRAMTAVIQIFKQPPRAATTSRSRRMCASFANKIPLSEIRGRRECRALDAPAASHAN